VANQPKMGYIKKGVWIPPQLIQEMQAIIAHRKISWTTAIIEALEEWVSKQ
jgi:hypothetical protein